MQVIFTILEGKARYNDFLDSCIVIDYINGRLNIDKSLKSLSPHDIEIIEKSSNPDLLQVDSNYEPWSE